MQGLYLAGRQLSYRDDWPVPEPDAGEALIRMRLAGICATDLEMVKGYNNFSGILGHEFVGQVVAAADPAWVGRRVVGSINLGCWQCQECLSHGAEHCPNRTVLGIFKRPGVFADYVTLPIRNLHAVPDHTADEVAVFTEPLAAALRIVEQLPVQPTARIAVVGPGRLGLLAAQVLALGGSRVIALGRRPESLALPRRLGLEAGLVQEAADNAFDLVVEATGNRQGLAEALRLVRPRGTVVLKSTYAGQATASLTRLVVAEVTVVGSRCGPFAPALRLLSEGRVSVTPLIDAQYPLSDGLAAFAHAARPGVRKVLLRPGD